MLEDGNYKTYCISVPKECLYLIANNAGPNQMACFAALTLPAPFYRFLAKKGDNGSCICFLTLKMPAKNAPENVICCIHLLTLLTDISRCRQIRLLLQELGLHSLTKRLLKYFSKQQKRVTIIVIGALTVNLIALLHFFILIYSFIWLDTIKDVMIHYSY